MYFFSQLSRQLAHLWLGLLILGSVAVGLGLGDSFLSVDADQVFAQPSLQHWLGTDSMGRDLLFRLLQGTGVSLVIATQAILVSILIAFIYGGVAGWFGRWLDRFLMTILDVWLSLPSAVLAAIVGLLLSQWSDSLFVVSLVIGSTHWGRLARIVRGEALKLREKIFIKATESMGATNWQILRDHLIPHLAMLVAVYVVYQIPSVILAESFLSFIGLGVQSPQTSWGILLQDGWRSLQVYPHVVFFPALALFFTVLSINSLAAKERTINDR